MGSKTRARELMQAAGVPIVPGTTEVIEDVDAARKVIDKEIGYPVAIKAAGGGGGKGFRVALEESELEKAFEGASREGEKFFSDPRVYIERYLPDPRHVEVQILADRHGNVIHLGERDCSVQRRHQKVIEEAPAPAVDEELRARIGKIGVDAAKAVDYVGAGTIEGLLQDGEYFFLEMNTRVQVEHCVTEMVDRHRHRARGHPRRRRRAAVLQAGGRRAARPRDRVPHQRRGRVEELRPRPGQDRRLQGARRARACASTRASAPGGEVTPMYDPMVAKLIVWDADREKATRRAMLRALQRVRDRGPQDPDPVPHRAAADRAVGQRRDLPRPASRTRAGSRRSRSTTPAKAAEDDEEETVEQAYTVEVSGRRFDVKVIGPPFAGGGANGAGAGRAGRAAPKRGERKSSGGGGADELRLAAAGQHVEGARRAGRDRRGGPAHLHHRGDEDGERDHRPQGRRDRDALRQGGRADPVRRASSPSSRRPRPSSTVAGARAL